MTLMIQVVKNCKLYIKTAFSFKMKIYDECNDHLKVGFIRWVLLTSNSILMPCSKIGQYIINNSRGPHCFIHS